MDIFVDICYGNVAPRQHREGDALITLVRSYISHTLFNFGPNLRWLREPGAHLIIWPQQHKVAWCMVQYSCAQTTVEREDEGAARSYEGMCAALQSPMVVLVEGTSHQPHLSIVRRQRHISSVYKVDIFNGQGHILCIKIHCNIQI